MATIKRLEDIRAWQDSRVLCSDVYLLLKDNKDRSFCDQMKRASVSVMNNIAEGFERQSNKEFRQFLYIAKGSAGEVRSMVILGGDLGYFNEKQVELIHEKLLNLSAQIAGFIRVL